jgi:hypothetical protein
MTDEPGEISCEEDVKKFVFHNFLLIDDCPTDIKQLEDDLSDSGAKVLVISKSSEAEKLLQRCPRLSAIVLDWYLNGESSEEAQSIIAIIKDKLFTPLLIYTTEVPEAEEYVKSQGLGGIAKVVDKAEVTGSEVLSYLDSWMSSQPIAFCMQWRMEIDTKVSETLWDVYNLEKDGLKFLLEQMKEDDKIPPPPEEVLDILIRILARKVKSDGNFLDQTEKQVAEILKTGSAKTGNLEVIQRFRSYDMYHVPHEKQSHETGDVYVDNERHYVILVTPTCDLHQKKNGCLTFIAAIGFDEYHEEVRQSFSDKGRINEDKVKSKEMGCVNNNLVNIHFLPYFPGVNKGLILKFERVQSFEADEVSGMVSRNEWKRVGRIEPPYVHNLIQRMISYYVRMGTRSLGDFEKKGIVGP